MKTTINCSYVVLVCLFFAACTPTSDAKKEQASVPSGNVLRNQVTRQVAINSKEDTATPHLRPTGADSSLTQLLVSAVYSGRLAAYPIADLSLATRLTTQEINDKVGERIDTQIITDPVTGDETTKVVKTEFNSDAVQKYRFLENWVLDPATGKTEIQITAIAPVRDIYGMDGSLLGFQGLFWLKYDDVKDVLMKHEHSDRKHGLMNLLWDDYFLSDGKPAAAK